MRARLKRIGRLRSSGLVLQLSSLVDAKINLFMVKR